MKTFITRTLAIALTALLLFTGFTLSKGVFQELVKVEAGANPYAKVGVITIAGPALVLAKWSKAE